MGKIVASSRTNEVRQRGGGKHLQDVAAARTPFETKARRSSEVTFHRYIDITLSMAAEAKTRMSLNLSNWENQLSQAQGQVRSVHKNLEGKPDQPGNVNQLAGALDSLGKMQEEIHATSTHLGNLSEVNQVMKRDADLQAVVVNTWPKNVFADRMTYLGTVLVAAGTGTYAFLGAPTEIGAVLLPPAILWISGFVLLVWGLIGVRRREALKWSYFTKEFDVAEF